MSIFEYPTKSVQELVDHWNEQLANNPLWSDIDRKIIADTIQAIEGKTKQEAKKVLRAISRASYLPHKKPEKHHLLISSFSICSRR